MSEVLYGIDAAVFHFLNQTIANPVFDLLMPFLTDLNKQPVVLFLVAAALIALAAKGGAVGRTTVLLLILTIVVSDQLNSTIVKHAFMRIRPCHVFSDVHLLVSCGSGYSFPSSHAVNNFAAATVLSYFYRKWLWAFVTFAGVIAFSRISVGVHYPSDILAGAAFGAAIGALVLLAYRFILQQWSTQHKSGESV